MPLIKSKSEKAFKKNISTEVRSGKPVKQAVAIAYSVKRDAKKADGGVVSSLKKAGFYDEESNKPKRLSIINKVTTKPERLEMVDKLFLKKKADGGDVTQDKKLIKRAFSLHDKQRHEDKKTNLSKLKSGGMLQSVNEDKNPGLAKLPTEVRNKMGYMKNGGLYANIHAKKQRIAQGSGEKMRKVGSEGAPTSKNFKEAAKTAKVKHGGGVQNP